MQEIVSKDCNLCERLCNFRLNNQKKFPHFFNGAVPSFGNKDSKHLIVGLAPGLKGANQTGRPFTGDFAGILLYETLFKLNKLSGTYNPAIKDNINLHGAYLTNAVRCVPPENKPTGIEIKTCNQFLKKEISLMQNLKAILALGTVSHNAILQAFSQKLSKYKFSHGAVHKLESGIILVDSYHCSRYNTQTKRLTEEMFVDAMTTLFSFT